MISIGAVKEKFQGFLSASVAWKPLVSSQFVDHLSAFVGWGVRSAQFQTERNRQEFFASTALNPSSIMAHAEDREYLPVKAQPSEGVIRVENKGEYAVSLPLHTEFSTDEDVPLVTLQAKTIPAGQAVTIPVAQMHFVERMFKVAEAIPFFSVLLPVEDTPLISDLTVRVREDALLPFENWQYARLLTNTNERSKAYDQFYSHTDQFGVRFGNGTFGKMPRVGSEILVQCWHTQGELFLSAGQEVYPVKDLAVEVSASISEAVTGGHNAEDIESIRKSLHYWQTYNDDLTWDNDYVFFLKRKVPAMTFINVWGEAEMEKQAGSSSVDFINKIFFSAYAPELDAPTLCLDALNKKHTTPLNKTFEHIPVAHKYFTLAITGKVLPDVEIEDAKAQIKKVLQEAYGRDSQERKSEVFLNEIFKVIQGTGFFEESTGASFDVVPAGTLKAAQLQDMVSIDIENTTITLDYL